MKQIGKRCIHLLATLVMICLAASPAGGESVAALFVRQESAGLIKQSDIYNGEKIPAGYTRPAKEKIHMQAGNEYTKARFGIPTFRNNAFRQNASFGEITDPGGLHVLWKTEAGNASGRAEDSGGYQWTNQPAIIKWSVQVRELSDLFAEKREKKALREVIIAGADGAIRFLDLEDGIPTRSPINPGSPMKGTPSMHPAGYPYMNIGRTLRDIEAKTGKAGLLQYNLYNQKECSISDDANRKNGRGIVPAGSFDSTSLIDRISDSVITISADGLLYLTTLHTDFDYRTGTMEVTPCSVVMSSKAEGQDEKSTAVESAHAMYDRFVFYADMGGVLHCVDTDTLTTVWAAETGDAVLAAVALDQRSEDTLDLYTANMLYNRDNGNAQIRRFNAVDGTEVWCTEIGVKKTDCSKPESGCAASPVIGENRLQELVYYTVNGLSADGAAFLGVPEGTQAALAALEKDTGLIRWARALTSRSISSPTAVYDSDGNGWIIQCARNGSIILLEGLTGKETASLVIQGSIDASPAVYRDILVVGTTGTGTEYVYGISIGNDEEYENNSTESIAPEATPGKPEDSKTDTDDLIDSLFTFFGYWNRNRQDMMLSCCAPGWKEIQEDPRISLFGLLMNRTPLGITVESVSGTDGDNDRTVVLKAEIDKNNGKEPETHRMVIRMTRTDGVWYIDPESLRSYIFLPTPDPATGLTPEPSETPVPEQTPGPASARFGAD